MNSANDVSLLLNQLKSEGVPLQTVAWKTALACLGWPYVYGGRGELCTPQNRRVRDYKKYPTIKTKCKNFEGTGTCAGCQWYPNARTRFFDCRGFTYWVLIKVYGWKLMGAGATSQWNNANNWKAKGQISSMPKNTLVCLFVQKGKTMEHTGFGYNNETVECSVTVKHYTKRNAKWTHWAIPACITDEGEIPMDKPEQAQPTDTTLKRGSKGEYVTLLQTMLYSKGYDLGSYGIDGDFGRATEAAVKQYQQDMGLKADGIVGKETWQALESAKPVPTYNVTIPGLKEADANELLSKYPGSYKTAVRG